MADNSPSSGGSGDTIATDDVGGVKYQRNKLVYGADGTVSADVELTNGYPMALAQTPFFPSAGNSSTTNLAVGATFTGTIQANQSEPVISINVVSDQPTKIILYGSTDAAGLLQVPPFYVPLNATMAGASLALPGNTNYYWVSVQNIGYATTKNLVIDVGSGWLYPTTAYGNAPVSINEIAGVPINKALPVSLTDPAAGTTIGTGSAPVGVDSASMRVIANMDMKMALLAAANNQFSAGFVPVEIPGFLA